MLSFSNYFTGEEARLVSITDITLDNTRLRSLLSIINEKEIKKLFFYYATQNRVSIKGLKKYLRWAELVTKDKQNIVFFIVDSTNRIIGSVDLQQEKEPKTKTVGFWITKYKKGFMTNAMLTLHSFAKKEGIVTLRAYTAPENSKAIKLLNRLGYINLGLLQEGSKKLLKFEKRLVKT